MQTSSLKHIATLTTLSAALALPLAAFAEDAAPEGATVKTIELTSTQVTVHDQSGNVVNADAAAVAPAATASTDPSLAQKVEDKASTAAKDTKEAVSHAADVTTDKTKEAYDATKKTAKHSYESVKEGTKSVFHKIADGTKKAAHAVKDALTPADSSTPAK